MYMAGLGVGVCLFISGEASWIWWCGHLPPSHESQSDGGKLVMQSMFLYMWSSLMILSFSHTKLYIHEGTVILTL